MSGKFVPSAEAEREQLDWGVLGWLSRPAGTGAKQLVVIEVELMPGFGHNFHKHPDQEEVIYVIDGQVEQWLDKDSQLLANRDSVFIGAAVIHASFNTSPTSRPNFWPSSARAWVKDGYELVEVFDQEPWKSLR